MIRVFSGGGAQQWEHVTIAISQPSRPRYTRAKVFPCRSSPRLESWPRNGSVNYTGTARVYQRQPSAVTCLQPAKRPFDGCQRSTAFMAFLTARLGLCRKGRSSPVLFSTKGGSMTFGFIPREGKKLVQFRHPSARSCAPHLAGGPTAKHRYKTPLPCFHDLSTRAGFLQTVQWLSATACAPTRGLGVCDLLDDYHAQRDITIGSKAECAGSAREAWGRSFHEPCQAMFTQCLASKHRNRMSDSPTRPGLPGPRFAQRYRRCQLSKPSTPGFWDGRAGNSKLTRRVVPSMLAG
ncbi:hypothetical protein LZ30DRAFT_182048 [Colletotrichum cereale]|nr:hypothetical protein LZ30DRAFT_182048 [Colletotrichum cereale]